MTCFEIKSKAALYQHCWDKWGSDAQMDMLIEEMAELTQAILKARRTGIVFTPRVCAEFADVTICMEQVECQLRQLGLWDALVFDEKLTKLRRLQCRVRDAE